MEPAACRLILLLVAVLLAPGCWAQGANYLEFLQLNSTPGVKTSYLGHYDDGASESILIPDPGMPFGNSRQRHIFVNTNGILSFSEPFYSPFAQRFPGTTSSVNNVYLIAPFWDDVDLRDEGDIYYETHEAASNSARSNELLAQVSGFVANQTGADFSGTWMLVTFWDQVHPWPHGSLLSFLFPDSNEVNSFQAIVITDLQNTTFTIFTYRCGLMRWARSPTIGYNAAGDFYMNHPQTGSTLANNIACQNDPLSEWNNVLYKISVDMPNITSPLPTIEPDQDSYLQFIQRTNNSISLPPCRNCSAQINLTMPFPFGSYYHDTAYVGVKGVISFGEEFPYELPGEFPTQSASTYFKYIVAPYWSNTDARLAGQVWYETYQSGGGDTSDQLLSRVGTFIMNQTGVDFAGNWMLVAKWEGVHPFPHGASAEEDRQDPYLQEENTFQAIVITNGTKSYAVFTYMCDTIAWSDEAGIGFNAAGDYYDNHPFSGQLVANAIDCVHRPDSIWNNVIFDLVPGSVMTGTTPEPANNIGLCSASGYTECCTDGLCEGTPSDCYCDQYCINLGDCCRDHADICTIDSTPLNGSYLLFANNAFLNRVSLDGTVLQVLVTDISGVIVGVDYDLSRGYMYWSDVAMNTIYRANLTDGMNRVLLVNTSNEVVGSCVWNITMHISRLANMLGLADPAAAKTLSTFHYLQAATTLLVDYAKLTFQNDASDGIALDWVGNTLYWTDAFYARIEVLDLDTMIRAELFRTGADTIPRGIAVDPGTRYMYWTDWGNPGKIEKASMDGLNRIVLHNTGLVWPNDITIDYPAQRLYWVDAFLDKIEFSGVDGSGRQILSTTTLFHPFSITLESDLLFWTDWTNNSIFSTHKGVGDSIFTVHSNLLTRPNAIQAVTPDRQAPAVNYCNGSGCSDICLLSATATAGFTCTCPEGGQLEPNGRDCNFTMVSPTSVPQNGSCVAAGYSACCTGGFCAGNPPTCFCDDGCRTRGDCCNDIGNTCGGGSCAAAGYTDCCVGDLTACAGEPAVCYCDVPCLTYGDCCSDFADICLPPTSTPTTVTPTNATMPATTFLPFLNMSVTPGVDTVYLGRFDDGASHAISIPRPGLPFGNSSQTTAFVGTNGIISFREPFYSHTPYLLPGPFSYISAAYLVAPFWSDVDITRDGNILYEVVTEGASPQATELVMEVSNFVSNQTGDDFSGTWMLVTMWDQVHRYPHGSSPASYPETNTYQAIVITDYTSTYSVFTYRCGSMAWSTATFFGSVLYPTIGFNAAGDLFINHPLSGTANAHNISCVNSPVSPWSNVVYKLSVESYTPIPAPTIEPDQNYYLPFLEETAGNLQTFSGCDDCSTSAISFTQPFAFGYIQHYSAYVGTNGIISFGAEFQYWNAMPFPTNVNTDVSAYVVAPYWADADARLDGQIRYEVFEKGCDDVSDRLLDRVGNFIANETGVQFTGTWMMVVIWDEMHPWPHGARSYDSYVNSTNTFQAILITNQTKSYAVFTYMCDLIEWSDEATIGFNAAQDFYVNHPLSGRFEANFIDCVHQPDSVWNNVIYDLVPEQLNRTDPIIRQECPTGTTPTQTRMSTTAIPTPAVSTSTAPVQTPAISATGAVPTPALSATGAVPTPAISATGAVPTPAISATGAVPTPAISATGAVPTMAAPTTTQLNIPGTTVPTPPATTTTVPISTTATSVPTQSPTLKPSSDPPGLVRNIVAMAIVNDSTVLVVSWTSPAVTNGQLTAHQVVVTNITNGEVLTVYSETVSGNKLGVTITGLQRYIPYYISIRASNTAGYGETANKTAFTEEGTPTTAPANVNVQRLNGTHMSVTWMPLTLEQARGFITGYTVTYEPTPNTGGRRRRQQGPQDETVSGGTLATIGGLSPDVTYSVTVRANTAAGTGVTSEAITVSTPNVVIPGSQTGLSDGGVAGVVIVLFVVVGVLLFVAVFVLFMMWRRKQVKTDQYAVFDNENELVHFESHDGNIQDKKPAELTSEKKGIVAFAASHETGGAVQPTSYQPLEEDLPAFNNPIYSSMGLEDSSKLILLKSEDMETPYEVTDERPKAAHFEKREKPPPDYETMKQSGEENPYVADPTHKKWEQF